MTVEIYIGRQYTFDTLNGERLDLFPDEKISYTQKNGDITNLAKNISDYTQTFTVPASPKNNAIFKHYWNVDIDNQFNANLKVLARIDVNSTMFRVGKVQLESVAGSYGGKPTQYSITFYSNLINLKDKFGDDNLRDIEFIQDPTDKTLNIGSTTALNSSNFVYTDSNVLNRITNASFGDNIIMPLASVDRFWSFDSTLATGIKYNNGTDVAHAIRKEELRPAVKISNIMRAIEQRYAVSFGGEWMNSNAANGVYMWLNRNVITDLNKKVDVEITQPFNIVRQDKSYLNDRTSLDGLFVNIIVNRFNVKPPGSSRAYRMYAGSEFRVTPTDNSIKYSMYIVNDKNEVLKTAIDVSGVQAINYVFISAQGDDSGDIYHDLINVKTRLVIQPTQNLSASVNIRGLLYGYNRDLFSPDVPYYDERQSTNNIQTINGEVRVVDNLPDMKVSDFFNSLVKMYNLVIESDPLISGKFNLITLNDFYTRGVGEPIDLTQYIDIEKWTASRKKLYQELIFKHEKNEMYFNDAFLQFYLREYGNDRYKLPNSDGGEDVYTVESKFGVMVNNQLSIYPVSTGLDKTGEPILNKPILFAYGGQVTSEENADRFGYKTGTNTVTALTVVPYMGTDLIIENDYKESITFSQEIDYKGELRNNSLVGLYYQRYLDQIYSLKTREWDYNIELPAHIIYNLKLNSTIIYNSNKHTIIEMSVDLITGSGKIKLLNLINNRF